MADRQPILRVDPEAGEAKWTRAVPGSSANWKPAAFSAASSVLALGSVMAVLRLWHVSHNHAPEPQPVPVGPGGATGAAEEPLHVNCDGFPYLHLLHTPRRNLGSKGPDFWAPPGLIYRGRVEGGPASGEAFELHVNLTVGSETFKPQALDQVGFQGRYGCINMKSGSSVTVEIRKFDLGAGKHVPMDYFITFFDLDQGPGGVARESITLSHFHKAYLAAQSDIEATRLPGGSIRFAATAEGSGADNPTDPLALTARQFRRAVTVEVREAESLIVKFEVGASSAEIPRWFNFRGQPTLLCAQRTHGSSFPLREISGGRRAGAQAVVLAAPLGLLWQLLG